MSKLLKRNVDLSGNAFILLKTAEECTELAQAIIKFSLGQGERKHVCEELAHVEICCQSLRLLLDDDKAVDKYRDRKLLVIKQKVRDADTPKSTGESKDLHCSDELQGSGCTRCNRTRIGRDGEALCSCMEDGPLTSRGKVG